MRRRLHFLLALALLATSVVTPAAGPVTEERGLVGLQLILRKLAVTGTVMHVTAHPDDENNPLMARQSHGQGLRVILATATRGNGGQNEIGPELFEALGVLRSEELRAAHRFDGAEQMFGRAIDFGYSFSVDETFKKWGKDEILGDYVRLIRMTRPDVLLTMRPDLPGGGQHHQASALLGLEAFRAAGDPTRYPEQIAEGLRAWQAPKIYKVGYYGFFRGEPEPPKGTKLVTVESDVYDPLLGRTYAEIGSEARAMHKCQGFGQLLALPGSFTVKYQLADTTVAGQKDKNETELVDGLDLSLPGLARFAGAAPPAKLVEGLRQIADAVDAATAALRAPGDDTVDAALARGHIATRHLRAELPNLGLSETARFEIDFRLDRTESLFRQALVLAYGLRIEALADDGVVTPGQPVKIRLLVANRGTGGVTLRDLRVKGFDGDAACQPPAQVASGAIVTCEKTVTIPAEARVTEPYWRRDGTAERYVFDKDAPFGRPFRPTPFTAELTIGDRDNWFPIEMPVEHRYEGSIFSGEKRTELLVVPAISVRVTPEIAIVPVGVGPKRTAARAEADAAREVRVTITGNAPGVSDADVARGRAGRVACDAGDDTRAPGARRRGRDVAVHGVSAAGAGARPLYRLRARHLECPHLHARLRHRRVPAHEASAHLRAADDDDQGAGGAGAAWIVRRLRDGRGRPGAAGHRSSSGHRCDCSTRTTWPPPTCRSTTRLSPACARTSGARTCVRTTIG